MLICSDCVYKCGTNSTTTYISEFRGLFGNDTVELGSCDLSLTLQHGLPLVYEVIQQGQSEPCRKYEPTENSKYEPTENSKHEPTENSAETLKLLLPLAWVCFFNFV